ncbi:MAG: carbohydrate ABC transporter permease [Christensenellales bacterium]|jgi:sn-glycerol 3-phosphate transport system permease protein
MSRFAKAQRVKKPVTFETFAPYFYIIPSLFLFILFVFYPFANTIYLSGTLTGPTGQAIKWIGLDHYRNILNSKDFWFSLEVTLKYAGMVVAGSIVMGLVCALVANEYFFGRSIVRTVYAMPMAISSACIAVIATFILNPTMGILNMFLGTHTRWLRDIKYALPSIAVVTIWMNIGLNYIFIIAALQGVDKSLYEAGDIDGTNFFQKHWYITFPSISPTLFFLLVINVINSFQSYAQIRLMTQGGPGKFTRVIVYAIYLEAFENSRYGSAAAMSVILFLIMFLLTAIQFRIEKKVTYS